jgi:hypothetical protein
MSWRKRGLIFTAQGQFPWMRSHAANPVPEYLGGDVYRIYFGCRDKDNRSHIGSIEVELSETVRVLSVADQPVVVPGPLGSFDDSGASMGCLVSQGDKTYLYYLGWNLGVTVPWRNSIGLAIREKPGAPFVKFSPAPLVDRSAVDPFTLSYPWVVPEAGGWKMWYGSNLAWGRQQSDMNHVIKYAESADGIAWERTGEVALGLEQPGEYALCRPCVRRDGGCYRMWYCHRGESYRLGYAESVDGRHWTRQPEPVGLEPSADWDEEMVAYPCVFSHKGQLHMLYCGNRYGLAGFGMATCN